MSYTYIYLYSFEGTNNVYIGKTKNIAIRCLAHKRPESNSVVYHYVNENLNNDWTTVNIDIIDAIDMSIDLLYLLDDPYNCNILGDIRKITGTAKTHKELLEQKIRHIEYYHIDKYSNDNKYNVLNIIKGFICKDIYEFYKKNDLNTFVIYRYNMPKNTEEKKAHAEYQRKYRERKMQQIGEEEYKQIEKKKAIERNYSKLKKMFEDEKELIQKLEAVKMADDIVDNLKVKRGRGRPKKA
jgi:hypothetical protein